MRNYIPYNNLTLEMLEKDDKKLFKLLKSKRDELIEILNLYTEINRKKIGCLLIPEYLPHTEKIQLYPYVIINDNDGSKSFNLFLDNITVDKLEKYIFRQELIRYNPWLKKHNKVSHYYLQNNDPIAIDKDGRSFEFNDNIVNYALEVQRYGNFISKIKIKTRDLIRNTKSVLGKFERSWKIHTVSKMRELMINTVADLNAAEYTISIRKQVLKDAQINLLRLKEYFYVSYDSKQISIHTYYNVCNRVDEILKMIYTYLKNLNTYKKDIAKMEYFSESEQNICRYLINNDVDDFKNYYDDITDIESKIKEEINKIQP